MVLVSTKLVAMVTSLSLMGIMYETEWWFQDVELTEEIYKQMTPNDFTCILPAPVGDSQ